MAVKIMTDSSADLPQKWTREYNIMIVPLKVYFGEEIYKDGIDIWSDEFYNLLRNEAVLPDTSEPSPNEFLTIYQTASAEDTIIGIFISQEMSATIRSAKSGAELLENGPKVEIIDSGFVSMALGLIVIKAARMAKTNATAEEIIAAIHEWQKKMTVYFTPSSLEYLYRTGRIGKASIMVGSLFNIKPILSIENGVIVPADKIRGNFQKVATAMIEKLVERYGKTPLMICVLHTEMPEVAQILQRTAEENLNIAESYPSIVGPVVGSHVGLDTIGIVAIPL
jgi:DegV family protein with EDD domain